MFRPGLSPEFEAKVIRAQNPENDARDHKMAAARLKQQSGRLLGAEDFSQVSFNPLQLKIWFDRQGSKVQIPPKYMYSPYSPTRALELKVKKGVIKRDNTDNAMQLAALKADAARRIQGSPLTERLLLMDGLEQLRDMKTVVEFVSLRTDVIGSRPGFSLTERLILIDGFLPIYSTSLSHQEKPETVARGSKLASQQQLDIFCELALLGQRLARNRGSIDSPYLRQDENTTGVNLVRRV